MSKPTPVGQPTWTATVVNGMVLKHGMIYKRGKPGMHVDQKDMALTAEGRVVVPQRIVAKYANMLRYQRRYARGACAQPKVRCYNKPQRQVFLTGRYAKPFDIRWLQDAPKGKWFISARTGDPYGYR